MRGAAPDKPKPWFFQHPWTLEEVARFGEELKACVKCGCTRLLPYYRSTCASCLGWRVEQTSLWEVN